MFSVGWHIYKEGDFIKSIEKSLPLLKKFKHNTIQIFVSGPRNTVLTFNDDSIKKYNEYTLKHNIKTLVHSAYGTTGVYNSDAEKHKKSYEHILKELKECDKISAVGYVLHMPKSAKDTDHISTIISKIIKEPFLTPIILENDSVRPTINGMKTDFGSPDDINLLIKSICSKLTPIERKRFGLCIDTSHLHATGQDLSTYELTRKWFDAVKKSDYIKFIHFNDNSNTRGSSLDKHDHLLSGHVFNGKHVEKTGVNAVIEFAYINDTTLIFERHQQSHETPEIYEKEFKKEVELVESTFAKVCQKLS